MPLVLTSPEHFAVEKIDLQVLGAGDHLAILGSRLADPGAGCRIENDAIAKPHIVTRAADHGMTVTFQGLVGLWGVLVTVSALFFGDWILVKYSFTRWVFGMWGLASAVFFLAFLVKEARSWGRRRRLKQVLRLVQDERYKRWRQRSRQREQSPSQSSQKSETDSDKDQAD